MALSTVSLLLLALVALLGTLMIPLSKFVVGREITVGPAFYNNVLIPLGMVLPGCHGPRAAHQVGHGAKP